MPAALGNKRSAPLRTATNPGRERNQRPAFTNCGPGQHLGALNSRRWTNATDEPALDSAFVIDRKPDGLLFGMRPGNAMSAMRLDQHVVAGTHVVQRRVLFELEHGRARQQ